MSSYSMVLGGLPIDVFKRNQSSNKPKNLVLIIPGNPGIVSYYDSFVEALYEELDDSASVWAISHSCSSLHELNKRDTVSTNPLEIEIEHKLQFLEQEVPKDCQITLVGHSIGCYMILSVLEILYGLRCRNSSLSQNSEFDTKDLLSRISKCYFLFPTIERMKVSPKGKSLWPFISYLQWLVVGFVYFYSWLPLGLRRKIASMFVDTKYNNFSLVNATVNLLTPRMVENMLHLAYDELQTVNSLHCESINEFKDKLVFYYGTHDGWSPLSYRENLIKTIPDVETYIDNHGMDHAFVLNHSKVMASVLAGLMRLKH